MGGKAVAKRMAADSFVNFGRTDGLLEGFLQSAFMQMVPTDAGRRPTPETEFAALLHELIPLANRETALLGLHQTLIS